MNETRERRKKRSRAKISGTKERPRLSVFRSNKHIYAQLIDDEQGKTLIAAGTMKAETKAKNKTESAALLGEKLAIEAKKAGINKATFQKGAYKYHGRVKAVAEGARKGGLQI